MTRQQKTEKQIELLIEGNNSIEIETHETLSDGGILIYTKLFHQTDEEYEYIGFDETFSNVVECELFHIDGGLVSKFNKTKEELSLMSEYEINKHIFETAFIGLNQLLEDYKVVTRIEESDVVIINK